MTKAEFLRRFYVEDGGCITVCRNGNSYTVKKSATPKQSTFSKPSRKRSQSSYTYRRGGSRDEDPDRPRYNPKSGEWEL